MTIHLSFLGNIILNNVRMPPVILIFALCAFALGFTEFVSIGLVSTISDDLKITLSQAGRAVMAYALGAFIGAPLLTAFTGRWARRKVLLMAVAFFTLGNLMVSLSESFTHLLAGRFISGLGHGVFLAVASTAATQLVGKEKSGTAISIVFSGLTLALAIGVPVGTYMGNIIGWRIIFAVIAAIGLVSFLALMMAMPEEDADLRKKLETLKSLKTILKPQLLASASITVMAYAGAFSFYTYISPVLSKITGLTSETSSAILLIYGVMAAVGNTVGGKLTDRKGNDYAVMIILISLAIVLSGIGLFQSFAWAMMIFIGLLGAITYAAVPALQARVIAISELETSPFTEVASGLNIAGFNGGIALGSVLGGLSLQLAGLRSMAGTGAIIVIVAVFFMLYQLRSCRYKTT